MEISIEINLGKKFDNDQSHTHTYTHTNFCTRTNIGADLDSRFSSHNSPQVPITSEISRELRNLSCFFGHQQFGIYCEFIVNNT